MKTAPFDIRLDPNDDSLLFEPREWARLGDDWAMRHLPTHTIFAISVDAEEIVENSIPASAFSARLVHCCEGSTQPIGHELTSLGRSAIIAFLASENLLPPDDASRESPTAESYADLEYDRMAEILVKSLEQAGDQKISREGLFPPLIDFAVALGLAMGGEDIVVAMINRMQARIVDWKEGRFPTDDVKANPPQDRVAGLGRGLH